MLGLIALIPQPRSGRLSFRVIKIWARALLCVAGCHVRIEHGDRLRPDEPRMLVANHASWFDPPILWQSFPGQLRFVLKRELTRVPFIGWYANLAGHFLLDREDPRAGLELAKRAMARAKRQRLSPLVFPEGTRSRDGRLAPLKAGAFHLALIAGIPVQPVAILGSYEVFPRSYAYPRQCGPIVVRVGDPIPTTGLTGSAGRKELARRVREALLDLGVPGPTAT